MGIRICNLYKANIFNIRRTHFCLKSAKRKGLVEGSERWGLQISWYNCMVMSGRRCKLGLSMMVSLKRHMRLPLFQETNRVVWKRTFSANASRGITLHQAPKANSFGPRSWHLWHNFCNVNIRGRIGKVLIFDRQTLTLGWSHVCQRVQNLPVIPF